MKTFLHEHKDALWLSLGAAMLILSSMVVIAGAVFFLKGL